MVPLINLKEQQMFLLQIETESAAALTDVTSPWPVPQ